MAISDTLAKIFDTVFPIAQVGTEIYSRFRDNRRVDKNNKVQAEIKNQLALEDVGNLKDSLRTVNDLGLRKLDEAYNNPMQREKDIATGIRERFNANIPASSFQVQPNRGFSGPMGAWAAQRMGKVNDRLMTSAAQSANLSAPGYADQAAALRLPLGNEEMDAQLRKAKMKSLLVRSKTAAAQEQAYKKAGLEENLSSYVDQVPGIFNALIGR